MILKRATRKHKRPKAQSVPADQTPEPQEAEPGQVEVSSPSHTLTGLGEALSENSMATDSAPSLDEPPPILAQGSNATMMGMLDNWTDDTKPEKKPEVDDAWLDYFADGSSPSDAAELPPEPVPTFASESAANILPEDSVQDLAPDDLNPRPIEFQDSPKTLPPEALERLLEGGPEAFDLEEAFILLNDKDKSIAYRAAEEIAGAGEVAVDALEALFPGRIFVDRYQHTVESLPPVDEHGPLLAAFVRIGAPAIDAVLMHLDDSSNEGRFYATYLMTKIPVERAHIHLFERLFDRDTQIRAIAQKVVKTYHRTTGFEVTLKKLRDEIELAAEEKRTEIAADLLADFQDRESIPLLIDQLGKHGDHTNRSLTAALRAISLQAHASVYDWRQWWASAEDQPRREWLVKALTSSSDEVRMLAFDEVRRIPGLDITYHPEYSVKEREKAQKRLEKWFASNPTD